MEPKISQENSGILMAHSCSTASQRARTRGLKESRAMTTVVKLWERNAKAIFIQFMYLWKSFYILNGQLVC